MNSNKLNGWQRIFAILAVVWIIPSVWMTYRNFPLEQQIHVNANQVYADGMDARRAQEEEVRRHCQSISGDDIFAFMRCMDINYGTQGLGFDERRAATELRNAKFHNDLRETIDRIIKNDLEQLPENQAWVVFQGLLIWVMPLLSVYALGLGVVWIKSGFKK